MAPMDPREVLERLEHLQTIISAVEGKRAMTRLAADTSQVDLLDAWSAAQNIEDDEQRGIVSGLYASLMALQDCMIEMAKFARLAQMRA